MAKVCLSVEDCLYIKVCTIWPRCVSAWRLDCISKYIIYGLGVPQCGGLLVYQSIYHIASVRRPDSKSNNVRYGRCVPQCGGLIVYQSVYHMPTVFLNVEAYCIIKYAQYGLSVPLCGGLNVYQSMYEVAELCLSVRHY